MALVNLVSSKSVEKRLRYSWNTFYRKKPLLLQYTVRLKKRTNFQTL